MRFARFVRFACFVGRLVVDHSTPINMISCCDNGTIFHLLSNIVFMYSILLIQHIPSYIQLMASKIGMLYFQIHSRVCMRLCTSLQIAS